MLLSKFWKYFQTTQFSSNIQIFVDRLLSVTCVPLLCFRGQMNRLRNFDHKRKSGVTGPMQRGEKREIKKNIISEDTCIRATYLSSNAASKILGKVCKFLHF
jgi:hypothetical protein